MRTEDYVRMGVKHIWVIDPWKRIAYAVSEGDFARVEDDFLRLPDTDVAISVEELFHELDIA